MDRPARAGQTAKVDESGGEEVEVEGERERAKAEAKAKAKAKRRKKVDVLAQLAPSWSGDFLARSNVTQSFYWPSEA